MLTPSVCSSGRLGDLAEPEVHPDLHLDIACAADPGQDPDLDHQIHVDIGHHYDIGSVKGTADSDPDHQVNAVPRGHGVDHDQGRLSDVAGPDLGHVADSDPGRLMPEGDGPDTISDPDLGHEAG